MQLSHPEPVFQAEQETNPYGKCIDLVSFGPVCAVAFEAELPINEDDTVNDRADTGCAIDHALKYVREKEDCNRDIYRERCLELDRKNKHLKSELDRFKALYSQSEERNFDAQQTVGSMRLQIEAMYQAQLIELEQLFLQEISKIRKDFLTITYEKLCASCQSTRIVFWNED